jgi:nucleoside phosphorylase
MPCVACAQPSSAAFCESCAKLDCAERTPVIDHEPADAPVFTSANLLEGARRQKALAPGDVPAGCLLDMDGELVERLVASGRAVADPLWPCFHKLSGTMTPLLRGASWTTDAPFRESASLIAERRAEGILSVEMEAAALLAMASALRKPVTCLAHVTNAMATRAEDFEKGGHDGQEEALDVCARAVEATVAFARRRAAEEEAR